MSEQFIRPPALTKVGGSAQPLSREEAKIARFGFVTAGHHFLLRVLPFREPDSRNALAMFIETARRCRLPIAEIDAVLLRCLAVLNDHTGGRLPSLVDRYVSLAPTPEECLKRFSRCVEDILRYRGVGDGLVQKAIELVSRSYSDSSLTPQSLATQLGLRLSTLAVAFKRQTRVTIGEHIRGVRLDRAAALLVSTNSSIKEVWASTGYNHPSNFTHDFKDRFGASPRDYRARGIVPAHDAKSRSVLPEELEAADVVGGRARALIVDDDECTTALVGHFLSTNGYDVVTASSGADGLQQAEHTKPRVVLLDYRLGDMDGVEVLRRLREMPSLQSMSVALFTADWEIFDRAEEVHQLHGIIASKICDLDEVKNLVLYLSG